VTAAAGVVDDQPADQVVEAAATGVVLAVVQSPQVEAVEEEVQLELVLVHTGHETVHGQSVMVKVVAEVTVYVLPPWVSRVAYWQ